MISCNSLFAVACMRTALTHLAAGDPTTAIALDAAYSAPSAFITAFRRTTVATPGRYLRDCAAR